MSVDFNCFIGGWPFHKVRAGGFADLRALHSRNGISRGFVSSTDAIFYNDPYEADIDLAEILKDSPDYHHVMTVNPALPGCFDDLERASREMNIAGVRISPGFHGYSLSDPVMTRLCEALRRLRLPLFLTMRMEDERITYMVHPETVPHDEVREFLDSQADFPVLLCNIRLGELKELSEVVVNNPYVYADCSGLKDSCSVMETLDTNGITAKLVYGSLAPLFCLKSTLLIVETSGISEDKKRRILSGEGFLNLIKQFGG